jgi:hypothetical protein
MTLVAQISSASGDALTQTSISGFDNLIWPTLILSFGPPPLVGIFDYD